MPSPVFLCALCKRRFRARLRNVPPECREPVMFMRVRVSMNADLQRRLHHPLGLMQCVPRMVSESPHSLVSSDG